MCHQIFIGEVHQLKENVNPFEMSHKHKDLVNVEAAKARMAGLLMSRLSVSLTTSLHPCIILV